MIMTFNVENLFDAADDPAKYDNTYLPLSAKQSDEHRAYCAKIDVEKWRDDCLNLDWSEQIIERKLSVLAKTILQVRDGQGPDIIALQEIENIMILERLRTEYLQAADYGPAILIEGQDERGIDVAFLSRLPIYDEPQLHEYKSKDPDRDGDTRGILEATFILPDRTLMTGFSIKWGQTPFTVVPRRRECNWGFGPVHLERLEREGRLRHQQRPDVTHENLKTVAEIWRNL